MFYNIIILRKHINKFFCLCYQFIISFVSHIIGELCMVNCIPVVIKKKKKSILDFLDWI